MRLAYVEDRARWSAAAVYRTPNGKMQAFLGAAERQGRETIYQFRCKDREVFYNGEGPSEDFLIKIAANKEKVVNINWGAPGAR